IKWGALEIGWLEIPAFHNHAGHVCACVLRGFSLRLESIQRQLRGKIGSLPKGWSDTGVSGEVTNYHEPAAWQRWNSIPKLALICILQQPDAFYIAHVPLLAQR